MKNRVGIQARQGHGRIVLAAMLAVTLAACGSSGSSSTNKQVTNSFPYATMVLGHTDYTTSTPNLAASGGTVGTAAGTLSHPTGSIATNGTLFYVADTSNHRILGWNSVPTTKGQAADFVIGQSNFSGNTPGTTNDSFAYPQKVSISSDGRLLVADTSNNRVLIWNSLPTANTPADIVIGQPDFTSSAANQGGAPTAETLAYPTAAMIANNRLFITDSNNNRLLIWDLSVHPLPTTSGTAYNTPADVVWGQPSATTNVANCGQADPTSDHNCTKLGSGNYPISAYSLNLPQDLWTDGYKLFIADSANNRVLYFNQIPLDNTTAATYVMGQATFSSGITGSTSQTGMSNPYGVASDGSRVFVADNKNNRVLVFNTFPTSSGTSADNVIGQNYWTTKAPNDDDQNGTRDANPTGRTLYSPTAVFAVGGGSGSVYVTDSANSRVLLYNPK
jgi:hypothetical protein